jgi:hypothetical protein
MSRFGCWVSIFSCLAIGCGGKAGESRVKMGPTGGSIALQDATASLQVPAGALDQELELTVRRLPDSELPRNGVPGTALALEPSGTTFTKSVLLMLDWRAESLKQTDTRWLRIVEIKSDGSLGATQPIAFDSTGRTLTAGLTHLGKYALVDLQTSSAVLSTTQRPVKDVDVLFLVDNSPSMERNQKNLVSNFPKLIQRLDQAGLNYRVGVVSSDLGAGSYSIPTCERPDGDGGKLQSAPRQKGCVAPRDAWIEKIDGKTNVPGDDVATAFSCIAQLGTGGCGFEQQLESVYRAFDPTTNPGFVRSNAALAVVFITDEDDCSAKNPSLFDPAQQGLNDPLGPLSSFRCFEFGITCDVNDRAVDGPRKNCAPGGTTLHPVSRYVQQLKSLKPNGQLLVSAITGPVDPVVVGRDGGSPWLLPSCKTSESSAVPAIRLKALVDAFGPRGTQSSICDTDFGPALDKVASLMATQVVHSWCLPYEVVDTNPLTPAIDGDCLVSGSKVGAIPACTAQGTGACYRIVGSQTCAGNHPLIQLENVSGLDLGADLSVACLTPTL